MQLFMYKYAINKAGHSHNILQNMCNTYHYAWFEA